MITRKYFSLDLATLRTMQASTLQAMEAAKTRGTSVGMPDLSASFPGVTELGNELSEISNAIQFKTGGYVTRTRGVV